MRVLYFAGESDATLTARVLPLANSLRKHKVDCQVIRPISWSKIVRGKIGNVFSIGLSHSINSYLNALQSYPDIVIIGRISSPSALLFQNALKKRGIKVIFDLDDALFLPTSKLLGANLRPGSFNLERMIQNSDFVTVNGRYLQNYACLFNKNVEIVPDPVSDIFCKVSRKSSEKLTIGWEGNPHHHYGNLSLLVKPLMLLSQTFDFRFKIVSYLGDQRIKELFKELEQSVEVDYGLDHWVSMGDYSLMLCDFDILVAPLLSTPWYHGKSSLRAGIGMALGIPVVGSPVGDQKYSIHHEVNGFLASTEIEWYKYLRVLVENHGLREAVGLRGRETFERQFSTDVCAQRLLEIFKRVSD